MIPMGDPRYVHKPLSEERRQKLRNAQLKRLGTPEGHCSIYGVVVPIHLREEIRKALGQTAKKHGKEVAKRTVERIVRIAELWESKK